MSAWTPEFYAGPADLQGLFQLGAARPSGALAPLKFAMRALEYYMGERQFAPRA